MPLHKPGIMLCMFNEDTPNMCFYLDKVPLGKFDRDKTLEKVPTAILVLAIGNVCDENNYTTPRKILYERINKHNISVLSSDLQSAFFADGRVNLETESEKITVVRSRVHYMG